MNPIKKTLALGQSIWLDYLRRNMVTSGELKSLVDEGVRGLTSNPSIFQKAICESNDYDRALGEILKVKTELDAMTLYERLAIEDIRMAADVLRTVYDATGGADGFISLEVSPYIAYDTKTTITEVKRLWHAVNRPNLMVKVPGTAEGIPAVEALIAAGININVTLIFSLKQYEAVAQAYIRGLGQNKKPEEVASVASFFVSRIDTMVDKALEKIGSPEAKALRGKSAIASSKMVYRRFREIFYGDAFTAAHKRGARIQRPLWGSTSTKNPAYSDVMYVEELIGPDTVNTVPMETLNAFRDHGRARLTLTTGLEEAEKSLKKLGELGIDLGACTEQLQKDGVAAFAKSFDQLLDTLRTRCKTSN